MRQPVDFVVDVQLFLPRKEAAFHQQGSGNEDTVPQAERNVAEVGAVPDADDQIHDKRSGRGGTDLAHHALEMLARPLAELAERLENARG